MAIAAIKINVSAGTAEVDSGLDATANKAEGTAQKIHNSFAKINFHEAQGGLLLLEDSLGFRLPRHLNALISKLPGMGEAFAAALPIAGFLVAGEKALELVEHIATLKEKEEELRSKALEIANAWQESGNKIRAEIDAQEDKIVTLNKGAVAGYEYAFDHAASVAISRLKDIQGELKNVSKEIVDSGNKWLMLGLDKPNADLDIFSAKLHKLMLDAEDGSNGDKFASVTAGINLATEKAGELQTKIDGMKQPSAMAGGAAMAAWQEQLTATKAEANAVDEVIKNLLLLSNLQATTNRAHGSEGAAKRVEEFNKAYQAEKAITDARTKETIAAGELEFAQGKINAVQLSDLKQAALDSQYEAERAHFEKLKTLDAGRSEILKQVLAQEAALEANHATQVIESLNKVLEAQKKGVAELEKISTEHFNAEVAAQTKESEATFKGIEKRAMALVNDSNLIQAQGQKKVEAINAEIRNLQRLEEQYKLTGKAKEDVENAIHELSVKAQHDLDAEMRGSQKLATVMHGTFNEMILDGQQWKTKVADVFKQTVDGMNDNLAQLAVTGKANFAALAQGAIESLIKIELQRIESHLLAKALDEEDKGKDASASARKAFKSVWDALPFPANAIVAPVAAAGAFAAAMAFERGGEVPDGAATGVPAILHPREMVLDRALADVVRGAAANRSNDDGSQRNGARPISMTTNIHALAASADEIQAALKPHIIKVLRSEARKLYQS